MIHSASGQQDFDMAGFRIILLAEYEFAEMLWIIEGASLVIRDFSGRRAADDFKDQRRTIRWSATWLGLGSLRVGRFVHTF